MDAGMCTTCGAELTRDAAFCPRCGSPVGAGSPMPGPVVTPGWGGQPIPTYLPQAILTTLFCCLPFGVVSIVHAASVSSKQAAGDVAGALEASAKAKRWAWISAATVPALIAVWIVLGAVGAVFGAVVAGPVG